MLSSSFLMACSDDVFTPDPAKDWAGTTTFFNPTEDAGYNTYFNPSIGRVGDPMPFFDPIEEEFKVLYLQEYDKNPPYRFHPIWGVATTDGCNYESMGEVLPTSTSDYAQDAALGTGCAVFNDKDGKYYIYYTGHNGNCENREVVLRATSDDFVTWEKDLAWSLKGTDYDYSANDFRDPQVFTTEDGIYHMVISTYPSWGGDPVFAEFTSTDMKNWQHVGRFKMIWDRMLECPDIFKMGDYWYLVYSESLKRSWSRKVKYMMAKSFEELKSCFNDGPKWPADGHEGVLDSRAFYAGKTASNGKDRYIWGWCPFRSGANVDEKNTSVGGGDGNEPNWSGALVCHKIIQHADGTLTLGAVPAMAAKYNKQQEVKVMASNGFANNVLSGDDAYVLFSRLGTCNHLSFTVTTSNNWDKFGISVVRSTDPHYYYTMVVNPEDENHRKVNFEQEGYIIEKVWNEEKKEFEDVKVFGKGFIDGIDGYGFERPADNVYHIDIYTDNSVLTLYINDVCAYTQRIYGMQKNCWSINNYGGSVTISDIKISQQ